jgi:hypothetical protein
MRLPPEQFPSRYWWVGAAGTLALIALLVVVSARQTVSPAQHERVGSQRPTTIVTSAQVEATIPDTDIATAGTAFITDREGEKL